MLAFPVESHIFNAIRSLLFPFRALKNAQAKLKAQQQQQQQQQSIMSSMQNQQTPNKNDQKSITGKNIMQKVSQAQAQQQSSVTGSVANQNSNLQTVQVSQTMPTAQLINGQTMFTSPWITQGGMTPQFWNSLQQPIQLASPILIRGTNPDGTPTFIQQSPNQTTQQTVLSPLNREYREYILDSFCNDILLTKISKYLENENEN